MTDKPLTPDRRRPYTAEIGMDALVKRADGSTINFGDAIYHPENADEARAYAARVAAPPDGHTHYPVTDVTGTVFSYTHPAPVCPYCVAAPSDGLREDAGYLADAAVHMADHMAQLSVHCEDASNVRHFAAKVRAALAATPTHHYAAVRDPQTGKMKPYLATADEMVATPAAPSDGLREALDRYRVALATTEAPTRGPNGNEGYCRCGHAGCAGPDPRQ
jgi:hypothetical protein